MWRYLKEDRWLRQVIIALAEMVEGEVLGYVTDFDPVRVRVVVPASEVDLVRRPSTTSSSGACLSSIAPRGMRSSPSTFQDVPPISRPSASSPSSKMASIISSPAAGVAAHGATKRTAQKSNGRRERIVTRGEG